MRTVILLLVLASFAISASGQQAPVRALTFQVAAIKAAPAITSAQLRDGHLHVGIVISGARVDIGYLSLADLIRKAYDIKAFQLLGPEWINSQRFDIAATLPQGATKDQVPEMLRNLLAERFELRLHHESKDHDIYALLVGKEGLKIQEAVPEPTVPAGAPAPANGDNTNLLSGGSRVVPNEDGKGFTTTGSPVGTVKHSVTPDGMLRMEASGMSLDQLCEIVAPFVDRPVVDMTELKGIYKVAFDIPMAEFMARAKAATGAMPESGGGVGDANRSPANAASDPSGSSTFTALQKLGLRLQARKVPLDTLVIDHVTKTFTAN